MKKTLGIIIWLAGVLLTYLIIRMGEPEDPPGLDFLAGLCACAFLAFWAILLVRKWAARKGVSNEITMLISWGCSILTYVLFLVIVALIDGHLAALIRYLALVVLMGTLLTLPMTFGTIFSSYLIIPIKTEHELPDEDPSQPE